MAQHTNIVLLLVIHSNIYENRNSCYLFGKDAGAGIVKSDEGKVASDGNDDDSPAKISFPVSYDLRTRQAISYAPTRQLIASTHSRVPSRARVPKSHTLCVTKKARGRPPVKASDQREPDTPGVTPSATQGEFGMSVASRS